MANSKISALTAATTPLAGTEVLPIVQSGVTKQVSVANLTAGRAVSMASVTASNLTSGRVATVGTSGIIQDDADLQFNGQDLGVGTAPKTWAAADFYGLQVGKGIAIFGRGSGDQDRGGLTSNAYQNGTGWKRIASGNAAQYYQNDGNHTFYTAVSGAADSAISWVEVAEIDEANKNLKVSAGNLVIGTSGKGIDFSATSGSGTSELLADYEEGTYTPTISGSTSSGSATYTSQTGYYTKIGNVVYVTAVMVWSGHTGTGNMRLSGLPFTVLNVTGLEPPLSLYLSDIALTALNVGQATFRRNATYAEMLQYPVGGGAATDVPIDAAGTIRYAGCFLTA